MDDIDIFVGDSGSGGIEGLVPVPAAGDAAAKKLLAADGTWRAASWFGTAVDHGTLTGLTDDDHTQYLLANGTRALTADWDAGSFEIRAQTFESDVATGTAPLVIASTTLVTNLNADLLDGQHGSYYTDATNLTNVSTNRLLGRDTAGTGAVEEISAGAGISFTGAMSIEWDGLVVRKNSGADVGTRRRVNLIEGSNITLTVADDAGDGEVDVTIASTGGGVTDHGALTGLGDDDHTQYLLLAGRAGGQTAYGGTAASENLNLNATSHATKGTVTITGLREKVAAGDSLWIDATNRNVLLGSSDPGNVATLSGTDNVAIGDNALGSTTTAASVIALGTDAAALVSTASGGGVFIGGRAAGTDTDPEDCVVVGVAAAYLATTLHTSTIIGRVAAPYGGSGATIIGAYAGYGATSAVSGATFVGAQIADAGTSPSNYATGVGAQALKDANGATGTSALGYQAGQNVTTSQYSILLGYNAAPTLTTGGGNIVARAADSSLGDVPAAGSANYLVLAASESLAVVDPTSRNVWMGSSKPGNWLTSSGTDNVAIGDNALGSATTISSSIAIGSGAAYAASTGGLIAIGTNAAATDTDPAGAICIGAVAGQNATTLADITLVGRGALPQGGSSSVAVGAYAAYFVTTAAGMNNAVLVGAYSHGGAGTNASNQATGVGTYALYDADGATGTSAFGYQAGQNVTTSQYSILLGHNAAPTLTTGGGNIVARAADSSLGDVPAAGSANYLVLAASESLAVVDPTSRNVWMGSSKPGNWLTSSGTDNVAIGDNALGAATTAASVVAAGSGAAALVSTASGGVFIGYGAASADTDPEDSLAIGHSAAYLATTLSAATIIGRVAAPYGGTHSTIIGAYTGYGATSAFSGTTYIGSQIADTGTSPSNYATGVGAQALKDSNGATGTSALGYQAGQNVTTGTYNLLGGYNVAPTLTSGNNCIVLGSYEDTSVYADVAAADVDGQIVIAAEGQNELATRIPVHIVVMPVTVAGGATDGNTIIGGSSGNWRAGLVAGGGSSNTIYGGANFNALTSGTQNVGVGYGNASATTSGSRNIYLGVNLSAPAASTSDHMNIGGAIFGDISSNKTIRLGGSGVVSQTERLAVTQATDDTSEVLSIETTGASGAKSRAYVGTQAPGGTITANPGSVYYRVNGTSSSVYVNTGAGSGTTWTDLNSAGGLADGDKGDITVSGGGATWTIDNDVVTYAKMQNVSAASRVLGRGSAGGSGDVEELTLGDGLTISTTALTNTHPIGIGIRVSQRAYCTV